jgi:hypothetical protein
MQKRIAFLLGMCFVVGLLSNAVADDMSDGTMPPPKVLVISREFVKPGKTGSVHEKSESAFVQAMAKAKWPTHYLAVTSLSGRSRVLFLTPYDSFDAWEKDEVATMKNSTLSAALDHALVADGDLLSDYDQTVATYDEDQSLRANVDIAHMRLFEISLYRVKPGHRDEWKQIVDLVKTGSEKVPSAHWATYEVAYGQQEGTTYLVFSARKSGSEIDQAFAEDKDFVAAMGDDGMKKLRDLESSAIESDQTNLFVFSPSMSYAPDEWIKADPEFWKMKSMSPAGAMKMKKPAEKPAQ